MALNLKHLTKARLRNRLRELYRESEGDRRARISALILRTIADGDVSDANWRSEFGKDAAQYAVLKARLEKLRDAWREIKASRGDE
ncbi:MAG: hypothetical protein KBE22_00220 [Candidatus Accumulibacter sp.]|nr:hypothetical protein [Accumulibacter sp.]